MLYLKLELCFFCEVQIYYCKEFYVTLDFLSLFCGCYSINCSTATCIEVLLVLCGAGKKFRVPWPLAFVAS
jgi:hypothetical protein